MPRQISAQTTMRAWCQQKGINPDLNKASEVGQVVLRESRGEKGGSHDQQGSLVDVAGRL